ncbi:ARMC8 [Lepeophtheirus salmonis]|uniref:Armadillo repeat-containing protein 8 n=1 Tax=Lepeophtheirus salmonis TaxID=72036 RepID=A0A7R8CNI3_LEPSM|nr:ARMC8 [Lepeophtheirus salmonis]CAF2875510.1 ARMC8 [Lepeophtheirus salmonis]
MQEENIRSSDHYRAKKRKDGRRRMSCSWSVRVDYPRLSRSCFSAEEDKYSRAVVTLKSCLIGSNKQKHTVIEQGVVPRLIKLLIEPKTKPILKADVAVALGSIAKGNEDHLKVIIDSEVVPVLLDTILTNSLHHENVTEACLRCLRTIFHHPDAPVELLYSNAKVVPHLILLIPTHQITVPSILTNACKSREHQNILATHSLVNYLHTLLCSPLSDVQLPALQCLAYLIFNNDHVAKIASNSSYKGVMLIDWIVTFLNRDKKVEIQLAAARCLSYLNRCGILQDDDPKILYKALPCVIRMTKKEESIENRLLAAETLAYAVEVSAELQRIAAISNHLIPTISSFLWWEPETKKFSSLEQTKKNSAVNETLAKDMKRASFRVFASLVHALEDPDAKLQMSAIGCLHSLSRSVQLLRTTFQDHPVWQPLMKMLSLPNSSSVESLIVASSTLCNLLLEFSPSKEHILDSGAIELLCELTSRYEVQLRLNGVWGLMNMAFQAEQPIKVQIITSLQPDQIFRLLSDSDVKVVMKTLGLLRNLLSNKAHIDHIMTLYGAEIMQSVVLILDSDNQCDVKEQALCILGNIADGDSAKDFIMSHEDILKKVINFMVHSNVQLQMAAVYCIQNLIWDEEEGSIERQNILIEMGVQKILHQLLASTDSAIEPVLYDKVKAALHQFS